MTKAEVGLCWCGCGLLPAMVWVWLVTMAMVCMWACVSCRIEHLKTAINCGS